ncbi:MAG: ParB/RepB/Spo0J family partition protein [Clostridiales bacterium]|nr:ParB/RepB/Spo0J family partition protein [Clostridiales bacterium]
MAAKKIGGLGKGFNALFDENALNIESTSSSTVKLKITDIEPNQDQPRKTFDEKKLQELADSIEQYGVLQPLLVRPLAKGGYQIVSGERRWRASRMANLSEVPVVIKEFTDEEAAAIALIENLQREDLNPIEEAEGLQVLIGNYGLTQDQAAQRINKSRSAVANSLRLLNLPEEIRDMARENRISAGHARALLAFSNKSIMLDVARKIENGGVSVREIERLAKNEGKMPKPKAPVRRDTFYDEVEIALKANLCRNIKVNVGKDNKGTLEIEFYDKEDLKKLIKSLED